MAELFERLAFTGLRPHPLDASTRRSDRPVALLVLAARLSWVVGSLAVTIVRPQEFGGDGARALFAGQLVFSLWLFVRLRRRDEVPPWPIMVDALTILALGHLSTGDAGLMVVGALLSGLSTIVLASYERAERWCIASIPVLAAVPLAPDGSWTPVAIPVAVVIETVVLVLGAATERQRRMRIAYAELVDDLDAMLWESDPVVSGRWLVNARAESLVGYPLERWDEPDFWKTIIHPDDRELVRDAIESARAGGDPFEVTARIVRADGEVRHMLCQARPVPRSDGRLKYRGVLLDVTEQAEQARAVGEYARIVERTPNPIVVLELEDRADPSSLRLVRANPSGRALLAARWSAAVGKRLDELPEIGQSEWVHNLVKVALGGDDRILERVELPSLAPGRIFSGRMFGVSDGAVAVSLTDVTDAERSLAALRYQATHDSLTGLASRPALRTALAEHLARLEATRAGASAGRGLALLLVDLDGFKEVNDSLGHAQGDRLLVAVAERLATEFGHRPECEVLARLGGDEFALLISGVAGAEHALDEGRRVVAALAEPFAVDELRIRVGASIGVALAPLHGLDGDLLTSRADVAMYSAKRTGSRAVIYDPTYDRSSAARLALLDDLHRAIERDELTIHFQPMFEVDSRRLAGAEALVRWRHPVHGLLLPGDFLELAEMAGLSWGITELAVRHALELVDALAADGIELVTSVNLSARDLHRGDLAEWLTSVGADPRRLVFEITEREVLGDPSTARQVLSQLRRAGARVSLDDFGTGYSSLTHLRTLPIDEVKVDRMFVQGLTAESSDRTIVRSIIDLAHSLGLAVVAEGVEDDDTLDVLTALGCDRAQGFLLGRPMPAAELVALGHLAAARR